MPDMDSGEADRCRPACRTPRGAISKRTRHPWRPLKVELGVNLVFIPNPRTDEREREREMKKHLSAIANDLLQRCAQYVINIH